MPCNEILTHPATSATPRRNGLWPRAQATPDDLRYVCGRCNEPVVEANAIPLGSRHYHAGCFLDETNDRAQRLQAAPVPRGITAASVAVMIERRNCPEAMP